MNLNYWNGNKKVLLKRFRPLYYSLDNTPPVPAVGHPDTEDDMLNDDLFPRHFIKALDPPNSYVGASRVFHEDGDLRRRMVRTVRPSSVGARRPAALKKCAVANVWPWA